MEIKIGSRIISEQSKPYFIADIAANHDGTCGEKIYEFMRKELGKR